MTETRLLELIATYGADPHTWPEAERAAGEAVLKGNPERYAAALAEAEIIDRALGTVPASDLPEDLIANIIAAAPVKGVVETTTWSLDELWPRARGWMTGAALASLMLGLVAGYTLPTDTFGTTDETDAALAYAFLTDDLIALAEEGGG